MMTATIEDGRVWIAVVVATVLLVFALAYFGGSFDNGATEVLPTGSEVPSSEGW